MLVDARRKPLPLPASALSEVLHARPFATLAVYAAVHLMTVFAFAALFLAGTGGGGRWGVLSGGSPPPAATSAAPATGLAATALRFSAALGGKAAAAASMKAGVSGGEGGGGVGSASVALFLSTFTMALLAGLAPALLYATGFKRRTQAYWRRCVNVFGLRTTGVGGGGEGRGGGERKGISDYLMFGSCVANS